MIYGIPNRPLYFYQKDIIDCNHSVVMYCIFQQMFGKDTLAKCNGQVTT